MTNQNNPARAALSRAVNRAIQNGAPVFTEQTPPDIAEIETHMARAFFASAWADACEESGNSSMLSGRNIMDEMPANIDLAAIHAARTLRMDMERVNGRSIVALLAWAAEHAAGDREPSAEMFGHYCAMQAMGHGVGLYDAFGREVYDSIRVPYCEFGSHSLQRDYF